MVAILYEYCIRRLLSSGLFYRGKWKIIIGYGRAVYGGFPIMGKCLKAKSYLVGFSLIHELRYHSSTPV